MTLASVSTASAGGAVKLQASRVGMRFKSEQTGASVEALRDIDLRVRAGEFLTIVGPSGCGKTTFLRVLAGLIKPTEGSVSLDGAAIDGPNPSVGFVFQSDNLMPWRNIRDNVGFGPEVRGEPARSWKPRVNDLLDLVGLTGFADSYPHQLSGGMRQRVNLARALAIEPEVLLMDEPFGALDAQTREIMQDELLRIWRETGNTVVFITHQIDEAIFLADRVLILAARPGRVQEILDINIPRPRSLEVKRTPEFGALVDHVWRGIERQVRASIRDEQRARPS